MELEFELSVAVVVVVAELPFVVALVLAVSVVVLVAEMPLVPVVLEASVDVVVPVVVPVLVPVAVPVVVPEVVVDEVELVMDVALVEVVGFAVIVSSATTPLLKSCSFAIKTFIGSIESLGSLQVTVLLMPILVAVTSAHAPSGFLG